MITIPKPFRLLILALASASLLAACGGSDGDSLDDRADVADPTLRFVHAVPDGPHVTLVRNGTAESDVTNVAYLFGSQYYDIDMATASMTLETAAGHIALASTSFEPERGDKTTLLALPAASGVSLLQIHDPYNKSVSSDNARVRVVNAAFGGGAVDVYLLPPGQTLNGSAPTIANVGYGEAAPGSGHDSVELEGNTYKLRVTVAGSKTVVFSQSVEVPQNADWLLVTVPASGVAAASPSDIRILRVRSDDSADATDVLNPS